MWVVWDRIRMAMQPGNKSYQDRRQSIPMVKQPQTLRVKRDRPVCKKCQDTNIVKKPDGSYRCRRCGFDSAKDK
jgi:ribosomal protein L37AE/L43A